MSTYYKVNNMFYAAVDEDRILFGNPKLLAMPCVDVEVIDDLIYINNVSHNISCNIENNLGNGELGTVCMINTVIGFVLQLYPNCKRIELSDTSGFIDKVNGRSTNLADRDMFLYKKTWYQRKFPFFKLKPKDKLAKQRIHELLTKLDSKPSRQDCNAIGIAASTTLLDGIANIKDDVYSVIQKAMYVYGIPSLFGMPFIGKIPDVRTTLTVSFKQIKHPKHPKASKLRAQWGGDTNNHFRHITWME